MLCFGDTRIVHTTLHVGIAQAVALITRERVNRVIAAADVALRRLGVTSPKLYVSGLNPHAGEGGLFGREEIEIISPAMRGRGPQGHRCVRAVRCRHHVHQRAATPIS